jgi:hypothetical protein
MKTKLLSLLVAVSALGLITAAAQPGGPGGMGGPGGPNFGGSMSKLFGDNKQFSATIELQSKDGRAGDTTIPGKLCFDDGKSRFEMDLTKMKNSMMKDSGAEMMKAMGMDSMVAIARPDKQVSYTIFPGMKAYAETPLSESENAKTAEKYKVETSELGKETMDGHPCVKNKVVVTDDKQKKHESIVWNATDLKKFPVRIETEEGGTKLTMLFKDIKLAQPDAKNFEAPSDLKRYTSREELMQTEMMKRMGGGAGFAPPGR